MERERERERKKEIKRERNGEREGASVYETGTVAKTSRCKSQKNKQKAVLL